MEKISMKFLRKMWLVMLNSQKPGLYPLSRRFFEKNTVEGRKVEGRGGGPPNVLKVKM